MLYEVITGWLSTVAAGIDFKVKQIANQCYTFEAAIPWQLLGKTAPRNNFV